MGYTNNLFTMYLSSIVSWPPSMMSLRTDVEDLLTMMTTTGDYGKSNIKLERSLNSERESCWLWKPGQMANSHKIWIAKMEAGKARRGDVHGCSHCYHFLLLLCLALLILFFILAWMSSHLHYDSKSLLSIICFSSYVLCRQCTFPSHPRKHRIDGFSGCFPIGYLTDKIFVIPLTSINPSRQGTDDINSWNCSCFSMSKLNYI